MYVAEGKFSCKAVEPDTRSRVSSKQGPALGLREAITVKQNWPHLDILVADGVMPTDVRGAARGLFLERVFWEAKAEGWKIVWRGKVRLPLFS